MTKRWLAGSGMGFPACSREGRGASAGALNVQRSRSMLARSARPDARCEPGIPRKRGTSWWDPIVSLRYLLELLGPSMIGSNPPPLDGWRPRAPPDRLDARGFEQNVNDPSAGSPTDTLLRLLLPLNGRARRSFRPTRRETQGVVVKADRSEGLARSFNR